LLICRIIRIVTAKEENGMIKELIVININAKFANVYDRATCPNGQYKADGCKCEDIIILELY
jgi:hypothetical protein